VIDESGDRNQESGRTASIPAALSCAVIFGIKELKPIINIPAEASGIKLRLRRDQVATAFVFFLDRIERWIIQPADGRTLACPNWKLGILVGSNIFVTPLWPDAPV